MKFNAIEREKWMWLSAEYTYKESKWFRHRYLWERSHLLFRIISKFWQKQGDLPEMVAALIYCLAFLYYAPPLTGSPWLNNLWSAFIFLYLYLLCITCTWSQTSDHTEMLFRVHKTSLEGFHLEKEADYHNSHAMGKRIQKAQLFPLQSINVIPVPLF